MAEPWELSEDERAMLREQGFPERDIAKYEQTQKRRYERFLETAKDGMSDEEFATFYQDRYGIDHDCHCAEDALNNHWVGVPKCQYELLYKFKQRLEEVLIEKDQLNEGLDLLRFQIAELGEAPRA